jgi:hypothetical protein
MPKPVLTVIPKSQEGLRAKLDKLALSLADSLLSKDVPIPDRIAGLKALAAYHNGKGGDAPRSAFDTYRQAMKQGTDDAAEDES